MSRSKKPSKAAVARRRAELLAADAQPSLPDALADRMESYCPRNIPGDTWDAIRSTFKDILVRSTATKVSFFGNQCSWVAHFVAWAHGQGLTLGRHSLLTADVIDRYVKTALEGNTEGTRATKRSELRRIARVANPDWDGPRRPVIGKRSSVKEPYSDAEVAAILRVATTQPSELRRRQLSTMCALGLGAGLRPADLRGLLRQHLEVTEELVTVHVQGRWARSVRLLPEYRDLLLEAIHELAPDDPVIHTSDGRDLVNKIVEKSVTVGDGPAIQQMRLRATWLAVQVSRPQPLLDLLEAAGLRTARSLVEIAEIVAEREVG